MGCSWTTLHKKKEKQNLKCREMWSRVRLSKRLEPVLRVTCEHILCDGVAESQLGKGMPIFNSRLFCAVVR